MFIPILLSALLILFIVAFVTTHLIMKKNFGRGEYPTDPVADYFYDHYKDAYPRRNVSFYSGKNRLQGYIFGEENTKGLLVFAHGINSGHESYIQEILWMVDNGWRVFAYDATGSCTSEGAGTTGLVQSALDLHAALSYIEGDETLNHLPVCLMGHSWGGYAVAAGLYFNHDVKACASISGYSDGIEMMMRFAGATMGKATALLRPFAYLEHLFLFGKYATLTATDGINRAGIPVMLVHGTGDELVRYDITGIVAHRDEITNPNVIIYPMSDKGQDGHTSIFRNEKSVAEIERLNARLNELWKQYGKKMPLEERQRVLDEADLDTVNLPNDKLLEDINEFLEKSIQK